MSRHADMPRVRLGMSSFVAQPAGQVRLRAALLGAIALLAAVHVATLVYHVGLTVAFPYDLNYGEGYVLNDALRLGRGEPLYVDLQQFPMVRSPYPPLFPGLWSLVVGVTGPSFWPGRALSGAALLGVLALLIWNARQVRGAGRWPILVAPALLVAAPPVYQWAGYARVDLLALLFAAGGVCAAQWFRGWRGIVGAAVLCSLALWTKQTMLTAAVAVAIALALRSRRDGAIFGALVVVPNALLLLALNATTGGEFTRHVLEGNAGNPMIPLRVVYFVGGFVALHLPLIVAGVWWLAQARQGVPSPIAVYLALALLATLSAGNGGSSVNYLLEPLIALALAVPFAWRAAAERAPLVGPLLAATQLVLLLHWPNGFGVSYLADSALGRTPTAADAAIGAQLDTLVQQTPGDIIAEPAGFAVRNGRAVHVQSLDLRAEALRGRWRSEPLVDALAGGRFSLVITAFDFLPYDAERAVAEHFDLESTLASPDGLTFRVYRYAR